MASNRHSTRCSTLVSIMFSVTSSSTSNISDETIPTSPSEYGPTSLNTSPRATGVQTVPSNVRKTVHAHIVEHDKQTQRISWLRRTRRCADLKIEFRLPGSSPSTSKEYESEAPFGNAEESFYNPREKAEGNIQLEANCDKRHNESMLDFISAEFIKFFRTQSSVCFSTRSSCTASSRVAFNQVTRLRPLKNIALVDTTFVGNAIFLSTPAFPLPVRALGVAECNYLNMDSAPDRHQWRIPEVIVIEERYPGSRPKYWVEIKTPVYKLNTARRAWDLVGRIEFTDIVTDIIKEGDALTAAKSLLVQDGDRPVDDWFLEWDSKSLVLGHRSHNRPNEDETPKYEQEAAQLTRYLHEVIKLYKEFFILVPVGRQLEVWYSSLASLNVGLRRKPFLSELANKLAEVSLERVQELVLRIGSTHIKVVRISDGRNWGRSWWACFCW